MRDPRLLKDTRRAYALRKRLKAGKPLTEEQQRWLERYTEQTTGSDGRKRQRAEAT